MKKITQYIAIFIGSVLLSNCDSDFLDQTDPDSFDINKYYQTEDDLIDALSAAYSATRSFYDYLYYATEMKSDNTTTTNTGDSGGLYATFTTHNVTSSNTIVANIWDGLYNTIYKSNLVLNYIDDVSMTDSLYACLTAEAKFLRGLSHFYLVRLFGEIPVVDKLVETTEEAENATRQPIEDAYELIVSDFEEVADCEYLETFIESSSDDFGRVTRTAGAAMLGKVYLTMATEFSDNSYYSYAETYLKEACSLGDFTDFPSNLTFPKVFGTSNEGNSEIIFQCMYLATSTEYSSFSYDFQPYGETGLTSYSTGRGCNLGEEELYYAYDDSSSDRRRSTSIRATADGTDYYTKKYVDLSNTTGYGGNNWIEIRFADVFLMLAETYNALGDTITAITYLDKVRERADISSYEEASSDYHSKYPTLRKAIFHERRLELAFENHRWFDLQRLYPDDDDLVAYMNTLDGTEYTSFKAYELLLPIPEDELESNANFYQNDGY